MNGKCPKTAVLRPFCLRSVYVFLEVFLFKNLLTSGMVKPNLIGICLSDVLEEKGNDTENSSSHVAACGSIGNGRRSHGPHNFALFVERLKLA